VCDEAHLYLPQRVEADAPEKTGAENFERIAKKEESTAWPCSW